MSRLRTHPLPRPERSAVTDALKNSIQYDNGVRSTVNWTEEQQTRIKCDQFMSISDLDPSTNSISSILIRVDDTKTQKELLLRMHEHKNGRLNPYTPPLSLGMRQPLCPSEEVTWDPPAFGISSNPQYYVPGGRGEPCCSCPRRGCTFDECTCRKSDMECYHAWRCCNTVIRDGIFPLTYICQQGFKNSEDATARDIHCIGVKTHERIKKDEVVMTIAGVCRKYISGRCNGVLRSEYSIQLTNKDWKLGQDETVILDPVPNGNTGSFCNTGIGETSRVSNNLELRMFQTCNSLYPVLLANRNIGHNEFLMWDYGPEYNRGLNITLGEPSPIPETASERDRRLDEEGMERGRNGSSQERRRFNPSINDTW